MDKITLENINCIVHFIQNISYEESARMKDIPFHKWWKELGHFSREKQIHFVNAINKIMK